jgi:hypothetical protein
MGKKNLDPDPGSGMNIPDHFAESLETLFGLKILKFFDVDPDPGSRIFLTLNQGSGIPDGKIWIQDKHPGSATLARTLLNTSRSKILSTNVRM